MRISWGDGEGNSEMQTGTAHESGGAATAHRTQLSVVDESKRDMVNGIRHQENSRSLRSIGTRERQSIGGSDMTVNSFFTADEDESGGDRQKTTVIKSGGQRLTSCRYEAIPMHNSRGNFQCSSFSDDEDLKYSVRERKRIYSKYKPTIPTRPAASATSAPAPQPSTPDVSTFIQKKSLAQGMMDLALISANTNQLRYILEYRNDHPYFLTSLCLVIGSLFLQLAVGLSLIWNTRFNVRKRTEMKEADRVNNLSIVAIFMITLINVFLSTFGGGPQAATAAVKTPSPIPSIPSLADPPIAAATVTIAIPMTTTTTVSANNNPLI